MQEKKPKGKADEIRRRIQGQIGNPKGRYWFLPSFIDIPDLYCDFFQLYSIAYADLKDKYERIAVLDTPFAEALQASFVAFYSAIGTPNLDPSRFEHLVDNNSSE